MLPIDRSTTQLRPVITSARRIWLVLYPIKWHPRPEPLQPLIGEIRSRPVIRKITFEHYYGGVVLILYGPPTT
jgi:hypothetical protein